MQIIVGSGFCGETAESNSSRGRCVYLAQVKRRRPIPYIGMHGERGEDEPRCY
jgi:hypothetical protein